MSLRPEQIHETVTSLAPVLRDVARKIHFKIRSSGSKNTKPRLGSPTQRPRTVRRCREAVRRSRNRVPRARLELQGAAHRHPRRVRRAARRSTHACGHNLIASGALGAFLALAAHKTHFSGTLDLLGTPAEEGGGGKVRLLERGAFEGVDAAMMFHPFDRDLLMHPTLACVWLVLTFRGRPAHAALAPHDGASALTACMDTFRLVDGQRVHMKDGVRVHGFITNGGQAVNIVPELAGCEFSVRANDTTELARVQAIVERCARAAAMASDVEVEVERRDGYKDMRNNAAMARRFGEHLASLGRTAREVDPTIGTGSTDMGDVSHAVPSIHPWIAICDEGTTSCHQHAFAACAGSARGEDGMLLAAEAMARTAFDLLRGARAPRRREARVHDTRSRVVGRSVALIHIIHDVQRVLVRLGRDRERPTKRPPEHVTTEEQRSDERRHQHRHDDVR